MRTTRDDCHRPTTLLPSDYQHLLSFNFTTTRDGFPIPAMNVDVMLKITSDPQHPRWRKPSGKGGCDVCGAHFVFGDVFLHIPTSETIVVGWECAEAIDALAHATDATHAEVLRGVKDQRDLALAALRREEKKTQRDAFVARFPGLADALTGKHHILRDLAEKLATYGNLSEKQVDLALRLRRDELKPAPKLSPIPAEYLAGRVTLTGRVVSLKHVVSDYGTTVKMLVEITLPDQTTFRVYGTRPIVLHEAQRDDVVVFTAAVEKSRDDASFGFFSRPTGGVVLLGPPAAAA